ncbi:DEAD/DEAH box helicase [Marivirga sp.]|uniref:DEAD/DEAH box helicase n=1 Tax=Marivirga sp. TaxID=2018662 RepID=UPI002D811318|nr:DEAD/DEAH box helicase [Marivirga sp.]HET8860359.1 DEAD/DEAH box helicase [Marivirga sp.]
MQKEALQVLKTSEDTILLSPTGSGKTLAFLLPIIESLDPESKEIQVLIIVPSRELALQIEQVVREMGSGYKANAIYGGRAGSKDKIDLQHPPAILIGTPGRIADHIERESFAVKSIKTLVLDEFDKSLEIGFEAEMKAIIWELPQIRRKILTSATEPKKIPAFVGLRDPFFINYLHEGNKKLSIKVVKSAKKDKLETLVELINQIGNQPSIVFCNFKDSIDRVSEFLNSMNIPHGSFYGGLEQNDRERALIKFRNGTYHLLLATDLAARGIDVPEIKFIIHYHLPIKAEEFTHRNGRTARMHQSGTAYVLQSPDEQLPDFIPSDYISLQEIEKGEDGSQKFETLFISGGRKDKISKGDIAGLFMKEGKLTKEELGIIELKQDCAFVAVKSDKANNLVSKLNNTHLKKRKIRIKVL